MSRSCACTIFVFWAFQSAPSLYMVTLRLRFLGPNPPKRLPLFQHACTNPPEPISLFRHGRTPVIHIISLGPDNFFFCVSCADQKQISTRCLGLTDLIER